MSTWEESYLGQLRQHVGHRKLLLVGARAFIHDDRGRTLLIRRSDNRQWALPAGSMELEESVAGCLEREVREETGLAVVSATLIAIYSEPGRSWTDQYSNEYQGIVFQFRVDEWTGSLVRETDETIDAGFFTEGEHTEAFEFYREAFEDLKRFDGSVFVK